MTIMSNCFNLVNNLCDCLLWNPMLRIRKKYTYSMLVVECSSIEFARIMFSESFLHGNNIVIIWPSTAATDHNLFNYVLKKNNLFLWFQDIMHFCCIHDKLNAMIGRVQTEKMNSKEWHASDQSLLRVMDVIQNRMHSRQPFYHCFRRLFIYAALENNRESLLRRLLTDESCLRNSPIPCKFIALVVYEMAKKGIFQWLLLNIGSSLTRALVCRLRDIISEDLLTVVGYACMTNHLESLRFIVSYAKDLNLKR